MVQLNKLLPTPLAQKMVTELRNQGVEVLANAVSDNAPAQKQRNNNGGP